MLKAIGRRLNNPEIAEELFISVRTVESHVAALLRKLEASNRADLIEAANHIRRVTAVELPTDSFVGREADVDAVEQLLEKHRLVTIAGTPGSGKSRLALQVAVQHRLIPVVVGLDRTASGGVLSAIASALGLAVDRRVELVDSCATALSSGGHLLLLDDCDGLVEEVSAAAIALLARVSDLHMLVTTRTPLGSAGEAVHLLEPLDTGHPTDSSASRLFRDRMGSAGSRTVLTDLEILNITHICRRLDGLPLAIELAASRVRLMSVGELARQLENRLEILQGPGRPARHRTLEAAFAWSWDMLDSTERLALTRLAALPEDFDLTLAEAVVGPEAASVVSRLLDRSFLTRSTTSVDPARYRLLESIRTFVITRSDPEILAEARGAHARYCLSIGTQLADRLPTDDRPATTDLARRQTPDIAAAINWATKSDPDLALKLSRALSIIVEHIAPEGEAIEAILSAVRSPHVLSNATAEDLFQIGQALLYGDLDAVGELAEMALTRASDPAATMYAHHLAGFHLAYLERPSEARVHLAEAARLAEKLNAEWELASILQAEGLALQGEGELEAALTAFQLSLEGFARAGASKSVNNVRYMMARAAAESDGHRAEAIDWAEQCLTYASEKGNDHEHAHATLVRAALEPNDESCLAIEGALEVFKAVGDLRCLARSYQELARHMQPADQVPLLLDALAAAVKAHDRPRQAQILIRLIGAYWQSDDHRRAALTLGCLMETASPSAITPAIPKELLSEQWTTVVAEGRGGRTISLLAGRASSP